jgi:hypothetical protein
MVFVTYIIKVVTVIYFRLMWVLYTICYLSVKFVLIENCDMNIMTDTHGIIRHTSSYFNPLTPNDFIKRCAVSPLKIKIPSKNVLEKPTNTPVIHSVY